MSSKPTRDEWLAARKRVSISLGRHDTTKSLVEAALGCPCPPEPAPQPWHCCGLAVMVQTNGVLVGPAHKPEKLTPVEAVAMAKALVKHAAYAREQGDGGLACGEGESPGWKWDTNTRDAPRAVPLVAAPICGRVLDPVGWFRSGLTVDKAPTCQRPEGHPVGGCRPYRMAADG